MNPLVSIIIPTLNRLQFIDEAIQSVLRQTYKNLEIIISDNGSETSVQSHIDKFQKNDNRVIFRRNEKTIPMTAHFNQCLAIATGKYIMYISDDDMVSENFIQLMVEGFESDDSISLGISTTEIIDLKNEVVNKIQNTEWAKKDGKEFLYGWLLEKQIIPVASFITLFTKTELLRKFGGFPDFEAGAHIDNVVAINLCLMGNVAFINEASFYYRVYNASFGLSIPLNKLNKASHQFNGYYKKNRDMLMAFNNNKVDLKKVLKGVKYLSFTVYIDRALKLYPAKSFNFFASVLKYGLGYLEWKIFIQKSLSKLLK